MIFRRENGRLELFAQDDHAAIAARFAEVWGAVSFAPVSPRAAVIEAIRLHDRGWVEHDAAPTVRPALNRPRDFMTMPAAQSREIWEHSIAIALERVGPLGALMVSRHFDRLAEAAIETSRRDHVELKIYRSFCAEQCSRREAWTDAFTRNDANAPAVIERAAAMLILCDNLSIALLNTVGQTSPTCAALPLRGDGADDVTFRLFWPAPRTLAIAPWPFARNELRLEAPCRVIPERDYRDDADLRDAYNRASEAAISFRVVAAHESHESPRIPIRENL